MQPERIAGGAGTAAAVVDDATLVAAVARGDQAALAALYDRHAALLLAVARRMLPDGDAAESALHDAFVAVWHHAAAFEPARTSVRAWLIGQLRAVVVRARPAAAAAAPRPAEPVRIAGLPAELAAVLELTYFEALPLTEVAARLGIAPEMAKDRLARALELLRTRLAQAERAGEGIQS